MLSVLICVAALGLIGLALIGLGFLVSSVQEMSRDMIGPAPHTSSTVESMHRYVDGAVIANQVAGYVANLGYSATANHLSRYDCLLVPLAVDAGMGEMGRLGYLMTREFGPRQRLSAVTTVFYGKRPRSKNPPAWASFGR